MPAAFPVSQCATLACLLEVSAPKPGNVHRSADFEDAALNDFLAAAAAIGPAIAEAEARGVGAAVLAAVEATQRVTATNTSLGTVLLLAPLAAVPPDRPLRAGIAEVLTGLTPSDARLVYQAINLATPGGMGEVDEMDLAAAPPADLLAAMRAAADHDLVARQYAEDFRLVLDEVLPAIVAGVASGRRLPEAIVDAHLLSMSRHADSLIARKCGKETAEQSRSSAERAVAARRRGEAAYLSAISDLDFWLRSDGNRRNPGATADLIAAALFAGLREGAIRPPFG